MDKYYVYRPLLDLFGKSEGTDKGRGYNETLGYGAYTGGDVELVKMTLDQIDALQTKMLKHPKNKLKSSALGRYQIIRTTERDIRAKLPARYPGTRLFDKDCQDEQACYLLGVRGVDKWLAGRLSEDTFISNLAQEWASIPKPDGKGHYAGQGAGVTVAEVRATLAEVKRRHMEGQPKTPVEVPVPVPAPGLDKPWYKDLLGQKEVVTTVAIPGVSALAGVPWQTVGIIAALCLVAGGAYYLIRKREAAKQEAQVAQVHAEAAEVKAAL